MRIARSRDVGITMVKVSDSPRTGLAVPTHRQMPILGAEP